MAAELLANHTPQLALRDQNEGFALDNAGTGSRSKTQQPGLRGGPRFYMPLHIFDMKSSAGRPVAEIRSGKAVRSHATRVLARSAQWRRV
jgi:hypothetical protein